jgi:hypothetical protein
MTDYLSGNRATATSPTTDGSGIEYAITRHDSRVLLQINGALRVGWTASLARGLTQSDINIIRGTAIKEGAIRWTSNFEIEPAPSSRNNLANLDVGSFFKTAAAQHTAIPDIRLHTFRTVFSPRHGGSLEVELSGADSIGFLAGILRQFSFYSLFPVEMALDTIGSTAHDRFWLKCIGNVPPQADDVECVRNRLSTLVDN